MDLDTDDLDTDLDTDLDMDTAQPATVAIYRGFSDLPAEMIDMIIDYSDTPELQNDELGKKRLAWAFTWTRINSHTRDVAIAHRSMWSTVYLHHSLPLIDMFLTRSQYKTFHNLVAFLHTSICSKNNKKHKLKRWTQFFKEDLDKIVSLKIQIDSRWEHHPMAIALRRTPAPLLHTFGLTLDHASTMQFDFTSLFNSQAPLLQSALIHTNQAYDTSILPSLDDFSLRLGPSNFNVLFDNLAANPFLQSISLSGKNSWPQSVLPPSLDHSLSLPELKVLSVKQITSERVQHIISNLELPSLDTLIVQEIMAPDPEDPETPMLTVSDALPSISHLAGDWLSLSFSSRAFSLEMGGYSYVTRWTTDDIPMTSIVDSICHVFQLLDEQHTLVPKATRLTIVNSITRHNEDANPSPSDDCQAEPLPAKKPRRPVLGPHMDVKDLEYLVASAFNAFSSVETLEVCGFTIPVIDVLRGAHSEDTSEDLDNPSDELFLPHLQHLDLKCTAGWDEEPKYDYDSLIDLLNSENRQGLQISVPQTTSDQPSS
ncbi:hypothetical protein SISSUDRAFT_1132676 [Sistotremastrum suecicum HHB10207 ss-3]|uniref:F-box domain-containing protein n=1 Tax=Sistotremastrum suecicum HHB10207 ss-3 TaxID=1314776 RepID=A0A165YGH0_9AGAM|nr:hypothetical protein SISSUDRAFT_1132676 [Sistotremastrum suecicum HHB10207 ss-3]